MPSPEDRFWAKVDKSGDCWIWRGAVFLSGRGIGHGTIKVRGRPTLAHRFSWQIHYGDIPVGSLVCHHCDNPPCVNPEHLYLGTQSTNMKDRSDRGRTARGGRNGRAKLSENQVQWIRSSAMSSRAVGDALGINRRTVTRIRARRSWL